MKKDNIVLLVIVTILVGALCSVVGLSIGEKRAELRFLKQSLITPTPEWIDR